MSTTDSRAAFEKAMNDARFFPAELDFTRTKSPSGRDEYANRHLQSEWRGWQAALVWQAATEAAKATGTAGEIAEKVECPRCKGTGESSLDAALNWGEHKCADCSGKGFYWEPTEAARQPAPVVTDAEADFLLLVLQNSCMKVRDMFPADGRWKRPEQMGLVKCTGSWAWEPTEKLLGMLHAALAATAAPVLSDEVIHALWNMAWNVAIKEAGVYIGNADVAHMNQPIVFARLLSDATAINTAKEQAEELRRRNEEGLKQLAATRSQP